MNGMLGLGSMDSMKYLEKVDVESKEAIEKQREIDDAKFQTIDNQKKRNENAYGLISG